ncbi:MAG: MogA/MoaB family molybdenum cofactor biosynthesis protein [Anaerolineaceae bacterium]|nr:MogA/MoaB family molybdenum cofactor biosynthesis protein [Anaerolineaceae bacterium]
MQRPIRAAVLTVSDRSSRGERADESGPALAGEIEKNAWQLVEKKIVPDERLEIEKTLIEWCGLGAIDLILTTGGTGFSPRDVTPEATIAVAERLAPGLSEAMRLDSLRITPHAMLSRGAAVIRGQTLIVNLPGSPKAAVENLRTILPVLPHAVALLRADPAAEAGHQPAQ